MVEDDTVPTSCCLACVVGKITLGTAKRIHRECMSEYDDKNANRGSIHRAAHILFQPGCDVRRLGELWIAEDKAPLSSYPLLFETIFYYAFSLIVELAVEAEHKKVSDVLSHPGRKQDPPAVCASMRFPQVHETSQDKAYSAWGFANVQETHFASRCTYKYLRRA